MYYPNTYQKFVRKRRNTLVMMAVVPSKNLTGHLVNISLHRTWHCSSGRTQARNTAGELPKAEESNGTVSLCHHVGALIGFSRI
jgi:hypothetical protein